MDNKEEITLESFIDFCDSMRIMTHVLEMHMDEYLPDELYYIPSFENYSKSEKLYPVYIVMIRTTTNVAKVITKFTHAPYSHVSISFDSSMENMYSFGRELNEETGEVANPIIPNGSFTREILQHPILLGQSNPYCVYVTFVSKYELLLMKNRLEYFIRNKTNFKFNRIGLVKNYLGIKSKDEHKYFCSQFVSDILNTGKENFTQKPSSLMKPSDFMNTPDCYFVCEGIIDEFDSKVVDRETKRILRQFRSEHCA